MGWKFNLLFYSVCRLVFGSGALHGASRYLFVASMQSPESNHGTATASFCCEGFGLRKTSSCCSKIRKAIRKDIAQRVRELTKLTRW